MTTVWPAVRHVQRNPLAGKYTVATPAVRVTNWRAGVAILWIGACLMGSSFATIRRGETPWRSTRDEGDRNLGQDEQHDNHLEDEQVAISPHFSEQL